MALWMEAGSEPKTDSEVADLEAISALKESAAIELKVALLLASLCRTYNYFRIPLYFPFFFFIIFLLFRVFSYV